MSSGEAKDYDILFRATSVFEDVGALQFAVTDTNGGAFMGAGDEDPCVGLIDNTLFVANAAEEGLLRVGTIAVLGFDLPVDMARCTFRSTTEPVIDDFTVEVEDASSAVSEEIFPLPTVVISSIQEAGTAAANAAAPQLSFAPSAAKP